MSRPFYKADALESLEPSKGHAGLWFDKFCDQWHVNGHTWTMKTPHDFGDKSPKLEWLRTLAGADIGTGDQIEKFVSRLVCMIHRRGGRFFVFTTESRFVTGLGRSHPVENGFAWHPTLGTPYLPGSSVKGLVRAWAKTHADPTPDWETLAHLLGKAGKDGKVGSVCFLDAVPVAPVQLEADVMTPHYAGWSAADPPGDWKSPTPIPFLTTAIKTAFLFGFIPCRPVAPADLDTVSTWLGDALKWVGGGAKTAVGYGRFRHDDEQTKRWSQQMQNEDQQRREAHEWQEAIKSPAGRWRIKLRGLSETDVLEQVRINLEKTPLEDAGDRLAFAQAVRSLDLFQYWRKGRPRDSDTHVGKNKLKERARLIAKTLEESRPE